MMTSMSQAGNPFNSGVVSPEMCLSQCSQQCQQSAQNYRTQVTGEIHFQLIYAFIVQMCHRYNNELYISGVLQGHLRPMGVNRVASSTTFLQPNPMNGMNMMTSSNPSLVTGD